MPKKSKKSNWQITTENIYVFGREERVQSAYEAAIPIESIEIREKKDGIQKYEDWALCTSIK